MDIENVMKSYHSLTTDEKNLICNGVGAADAWINCLIPKTLYGLDITEIANIHDYMYYIGETKDDKDFADDTFLKNMNTLIDKNSWWLRFLRKRRAYKYYLAVNLFGDEAFFSKHK